MSLWRDLNSIAFSRLFSDTRLGAADMAVYGYLWSKPIGSMRSVASGSSFSRETLRRSAKRLVELGWAYEIPHGRATAIVPWMPVSVEREVVSKLAFVADDAHYLGEWLMRCLLDILVRDPDFGDNARPSWLVKGDGSDRLELDRWYRSADVAFEFQGRQHFSITPDFTPTQQDLERRRQLDETKATLCQEQGVRIVYVTARELDFDTVLKKLSGLLPITPVRKDLLLIRYLTGRCRNYRNLMAKRDRRS